MKRGNLRYHEWARSILAVMIFTSLLGVSIAGARRWELSSYSACSTVWLGRTDFTGVAYNPKDNLLWGLTSGHDAALHAYDLDGGLVRSLRSPVPIRLKGVTWLQGDLLALTLPGQQNLAYANIDTAQTELKLQYVPFRHNTVVMQDKLTYNAEAKMLMVTDLGPSSYSQRAPAQTSLSLVMLNGVVRKTTDSGLDVQNVTDIYYASQPRRLYVLSGRDVLELDNSGKVASRVGVQKEVERPVGLTFAPDGGKFMVLGADGQVHIYSAQGCRIGEGRRGLKPAARKPLSLPEVKQEAKQDALKEDPEPLKFTFHHGPSSASIFRAAAVEDEEDEMEDFSMPPITESVALATAAARAGEREGAGEEGSLEQLEYATQLMELHSAAAAKDSRQSNIFLYYWRLPVQHRQYMSSYSVCQAFNLTGTQPGQGYTGLTYNPERRTLMTITGRPGALAEYSIAGVLEQEVPLRATGQAPAGVAYLGDNQYSVLERNLTAEQVDINSSPSANRRVDLKMPSLLQHASVRGLAWDDEAGRFFVAQSHPPAVWTAAEGSPAVLLFTATDLPIDDISGIAHNRVTNTLLILSQRSRRLIETSTTGELVHSMELGASLTDEPHSLAVAGGGKVLFLLSQSGNLKIFSVAKC